MFEKAYARIKSRSVFVSSATVSTQLLVEQFIVKSSTKIVRVNRDTRFHRGV